MMKQNIPRVGFLAMVIVATAFYPISAQQNIERNHRISFVQSVQTFHYKEIIDLDAFLVDLEVPDATVVGAPKSTEYGPILGVGIEYRYDPTFKHVGVTAGVLLALGVGNTYDGSTQAMYDPNRNTITFEPVEVSTENAFYGSYVSLNYSFGTSGFRCGGSLGLRGYLWDRSIPGPGDFTEWYYWLNLSGSIFGEKALSERLKMGVRASVAPMLAGGMSLEYGSYMGEKIPYEADPVRLGNKYLMEAELYLSIRFSEVVGLTFVPRITYYEFGKSNEGQVRFTGSMSDNDETYPFYEPASRTIRGGLEMKVDFYL